MFAACNANYNYMYVAADGCSVEIVCVVGHPAMSESVFRTMWLMLLPHILTARPMTDLCWTCQSNNYVIYRGANLAEEEKSARLKKQEVSAIIRL